MGHEFHKPKYIEAADMGAAVEGPWLNVHGATIVTFVAKWASPAARTIVVAENDNVVAATDTWNIAAGGFTAADVGATFVVTGTATSDGTYTVESVTDGNTIVSVEDVASNETFAGGEGFVLTQLDPTGAFGAEGSNDGEVINTTTRKGEPSGDVGNVAITVTVDPADPGEDEGVSEVKLALPVGYAWVRLLYTPTTGGGILDAAAMAKTY